MAMMILNRLLPDPVQRRHGSPCILAGYWHRTPENLSHPSVSRWWSANPFKRMDNVPLRPQLAGPQSIRQLPGRVSDSCLVVHVESDLFKVGLQRATFTRSVTFGGE